MRCALEIGTRYMVLGLQVVLDVKSVFAPDKARAAVPSFVFHEQL
jgi:hypothetical protein